MDPDLEMIDGKTYTRPGSTLRRAEVRHMLNGYVTKVVENDPTATLDSTLDSMMPRDVAVRLVKAGPALRMNYRIVKVGTSPMLLGGRPVLDHRPARRGV